MERWSFNLQIYFLNSRFRQILEIQKNGKNVVQDRSIYEDAHIFAPNLHSMGLMTHRDFNNYLAVFELMESLVKGPDLMIYLRSSISNLVSQIHKRGRDYENTISIEYLSSSSPNLVSQIHKRGREYENSISIEYLSRLNERYEAWIYNYKKGPLLVIDIDDLDFVENKEDLKEIISLIDKKMK